MTDKIANSDKVARAEERLKSNSWDIEAWNVLLRDAQSKSIDESRPVFERLVKQFPLSGQYIKSYITQEKKAKNYDNVEKLFKEYLPRVYHIDLWKFYLSYIKEKDNKTTQFKENMAHAYYYALEKMGHDIKSFSIWSDYICFLKNAPVKNQYAESQKTIATRKSYQRAIVTPMIGIETIWRDYNTFENSINNIIAKRFIDEHSKDYMNARRVTKEYEAVTKGLNRNLPSVPPQNILEEVRQVDLWKKYINWEKSNPLNTEDQLTVTLRTVFAYEQCLLCLGHHPDIWYEAAAYLEQASKLLAEKGDQENSNKYADKVAEMYQRAILILKDNLLLGFAYADYEEGRSKFEKVDAIYNSMIANKQIDPSLVYIQYSRFVRRSKGIMAARKVFMRAIEDPRSKYQIYVNAAMMEHYCTKDPKVAQRIFELGLKKYMREPKFLLCYVDYMDHLNEDNNTRVLFERSLGSGCIPAANSGVIWDKFLHFESFVGDLASIKKVERRRLGAALENSGAVATTANVGAVKHLQTALIIDRYHFCDLYPCNESELRSISYYSHHQRAVSDLSSVSAVAPNNMDIVGDVVAVSAQQQQQHQVRPDFSQMLPFKPRAYPRVASHPVAGGDFPPPPTFSTSLSFLPPPTCHRGSFVNVRSIMELSLDVEVPEEYRNPAPNDSMVVDSGTALIIELSNSSNNLAVSGNAATAVNSAFVSRKRKRVSSNTASNTGVGSDDEGPTAGSSSASAAAVASTVISNAIANLPMIPSANGFILDVFKARQQLRQGAPKPLTDN